MANFLPGQKLTAADLNNAFQQVAGVQNPSNDYQWTKTSLGNLQSLWSTYTNTQNQTPTPLDIDIAVNPLPTPLNVPELGGSINAARCVFMNVGQMQTIDIGYNSPTGIVYPWGMMNNQFFIGAVGFQIFWQNAPIAGDTKAHFSLFSVYGNQPASDTPDAWTASEKLWQLDVCRNANKNNWWWTGIILERMQIPQLTDNLMTQIVAWPIFVEYTTTSSGQTQTRKTAALLAVSTYFDYLMRAAMWQDSLVTNLANNIQTHIMPLVGGEGSTSTVNNLYMLYDPSLVKTIASYTYAGKTTNAFYKQETNFVFFQHDFSESHLRQYWAGDAASPLLEGLQCVRHNGKHVQILDDTINSSLEITDLSGEEIEADYPWQVQYLVAVADSDKLQSPVLSCVSCDWPELMKADDPISAALSGLFNDLSCNIPGCSAYAIDDISKRLVLVDTRGVEGLKYFDTCPDFYSGKKETPDSDISSSLLSSIQRKDIELDVPEGQPAQTKELWSLWGFDDFENVQGLPAQSDISSWDLVARHVHDVSGNNVAEVSYLSLSALSGGATPDSSVQSLVLSSLQQLSSGEWSLFEFENLSNQIEMPSLTSQVLKDEFVIREWYDGDVKPAVVRYMPVSSMVSAVSSMVSANVPDADFQAASLSSIQTRTLDGGSKVLELYNFHNPAVDTVYLSAQNRYDFIMRDNTDHCVKYANLSGIGGEVALSGTDGSWSKGSEFMFLSAANSNISVNIDGKKITIGCYYI